MNDRESRPGILVDARGWRVPQRLAIPFACRGRLFKMVRTVRAMRKQLTATIFFEEILDKEVLTTLREKCKELEDALEVAAPHLPCSCVADDDCEFCGGQGWLSASQVQSILIRSQNAGSSEKLPSLSF